MIMKVYVIFLLNTLMKTKANLFRKYEYKNKIKFFSHNKLKFQHRTQKSYINCSVVL